MSDDESPPPVLSKRPLETTDDDVSDSSKRKTSLRQTVLKPFTLENIPGIRDVSHERVKQFFDDNMSYKSVVAEPHTGHAIIRHALFHGWPENIIHRLMQIVSDDVPFDAIMMHNLGDESTVVLLHNTTPSFWSMTSRRLSNVADTVSLEPVTSVFRRVGHRMFTQETWVAFIKAIADTWHKRSIRCFLRIMSRDCVNATQYAPAWFMDLILDNVDYDSERFIIVDYFTLYDTPMGNHWRARCARKAADPLDPFLYFPWDAPNLPSNFYTDRCIMEAMISPQRTPVCNLRGFLEMSKRVSVSDRRGDDYECSGAPLQLLKNAMARAGPMDMASHDLMAEIRALYAKDPPRSSS